MAKKTDDPAYMALKERLTTKVHVDMYNKQKKVMECYAERDAWLDAYATMGKAPHELRELKALYNGRAIRCQMTPRTRESTVQFQEGLSKTSLYRFSPDAFEAIAQDQVKMDRFLNYLLECTGCTLEEYKELHDLGSSVKGNQIAMSKIVDYFIHLQKKQSQCAWDMLKTATELNNANKFNNAMLTAIEVLSTDPHSS